MRLRKPRFRIGNDTLTLRAGGGWSPARSGADTVLWIDPTRSDLITIATGVSRIRSPMSDLPSQRQPTAALQPSLSSGRMVFDGTNDITTQAAPYSVTGQTILPDAPYSRVGKGLTCTGLALLPGGSWALGDHGYKLQSTMGSETQDASIMILSADFSTVIARFPASAIDVAIQSIQGVCFDLTNGTIWFAAPEAGKIYQINSTTGALISSFVAVGANALAFDPFTDALVYNNPAGQTVTWVNRAGAATGKIKNLGTGSGPDHFHIDSSYGTEGLLVVSHGGNLLPGRVTMTDIATSAMVRGFHIDEAPAAEGVYLSGTRLVMLSDGDFHETGIVGNRIIDIAIEAVTQVYTDKITIGFVGRTTMAASATVLMLAAGSTSIGQAFSLNWTATANQLRLNHRGQTGASQSISWTVPGGNTTEFIGAIEIDETAKTAALYVNGTLVSSQSIATTASNFPKKMLWYFGGFLNSASNSKSEIHQAVSILGVNTALRQTIEGFMAWQTGAQSLLAAGHPYEFRRP